MTTRRIIRPDPHSPNSFWSPLRHARGWVLIMYMGTHRVGGLGPYGVASMLHHISRAGHTAPRVDSEWGHYNEHWYVGHVIDG